MVYTPLHPSHPSHPLHPLHPLHLLHPSHPLHPLTSLRWRERAQRRHIGVQPGCIRLQPGHIWLQVSGDGAEIVEKFVVQQFIWPCASMLIDHTRPSQQHSGSERPGYPADSPRHPGNGKPGNGTPGHLRPEMPSRMH